MVTTHGGVLVSPRHVLTVSHYAPHTLYAHDVLTWVSQSNQVVTGTVAAVAELPRVAPLYPDVQVAILEEPVFDVSFAKIMPADWRDWFPLMPGLPEDLWYSMYAAAANTRLYRRPVITLDQERKALLADVLASDWAYWGMMQGGPPTAAGRLQFYEAGVPGDCGHPTYMVINGVPVLVNATAGWGGGTQLADYITEINALMATLSESIAESYPYGPDTFQLTTVDLSGFEKVL